MDRTVPTTGSDEIDLYIRTYYSLLRSSYAIQIETLVESHMAMESSLHVHARDAQPDVSALIYSTLRLPPCMAEVSFVLVAQLERSLTEAGYPINDWTRVNAPGRRRRTHFDGEHTLATLIASQSDIDDLIPILTAYQIEWNKLHALLQTEVMKLFLTQHATRTHALTDSERELLAAAMRLEVDDFRRLELILGAQFFPTLREMAKARKQISVRLITGSLADYRRGTAHWWDDLRRRVKDEIDLEDRPVYFVSSNTHSLINMMTGYALREEAAISKFIQSRGQSELLAEYEAVQENAGSTNKNNFLYYVLKKFLADNSHGARQQVKDDERAIGIHRLPSRHGFDIETQIIEVNKLRPEWLDPRLRQGIGYDWLSRSDAIIFNIDYPLGMAAYEILTRVTERVGHLLGVYIIGKAATLNARVGDVMISNVVHDEHSANTYLFSNCFTAQNVAPYMTFGTVLDNQKAISARGTFLQNPRYMSVFYREGYTVIEMEAGPYLSALYEAVRPQRHPHNEIVTLHSAPFEIGFMHYASDTPFTKGKNLGSNLSYAGVDPTYATSIASLYRIFKRESERLHQFTPADEVHHAPVSNGKVTEATLETSI
jgi:hypothetical protein